MSIGSEEGLSIKDVNFVHGCGGRLFCPLCGWVGSIQVMLAHTDVSWKANVSLFLQTPRYHKGTITVESDSLV